ncbi:MAG: hypothetical protein JXQ29_07125 [Planctomycetes bacterium]|nr:hypothetical protein [Planctomycetota bacterium]
MDSTPERRRRRGEKEAQPEPAIRPVPGGRDVEVAPDGSTPEKQTLHVRGLVLTAEGEPVAGAIIAYAEGADEAKAFWSGRSTQELRRYARSGADGRFELGPFSVAGNEVNRTIYARAPGFALAVMEGVPLRAKELLITLRQGQSIQGIVVDPGGVRIAGATVIWRSRPGPHGFPSGTVVAGDRGEFSLTEVPIMPTIEAIAPGFSPTLLRISDGEARSISLSITLAKCSMVQGSVVRAESRDPIAGATVELWIVENEGGDAEGRRSYGTRMISRSTTDEAGTFRFPEAPADPPVANAHKIRRGRRIYLWASSNGRAPDLVEVNDEEQKVLTLARSGRVSGRVVRQDGACAPGERVVAFPASSGVWPESGVVARRMRQGRLKYSPESEDSTRPPWLTVWEATSNEAGEFVIPELPEGPVKVTVQSRREPRASAGAVVLPDGSTALPPMVTPDAAPVLVHGTVETREGTPIVGARITMRWERGYSDRQGRFSFPYPVPDRDSSQSMPQIQITHPDFASLVKEVDRDWIGRERRFVLDAGVTVRGRVTDGSGHPVARAVVFLRGGVEEIAPSQRGVLERLLVQPTNAEGRFREHRLGVGPVELLAAYPHESRGPFFGRASYVLPGSGEELAVRIEGLDVMNFGLAQITIRVFDKASNELVQVPVRVRLESEGVVWGRAEAPTGTVTFNEVPGPLAYGLRASAPGFGSVSGVLQVPGNGQAGEHAVYLGTGAEIGGQVTVDGGLSGGLAVLYGEDEASEAPVDASGRFVFRGVGRGSYRILAALRGEREDARWIALCGRFEVSREGEMALELEGKPEALLWVGLLYPSLLEEELVQGDLPSPKRRPGGRPFARCDGEVRVQVRDQRGELWYDGPPNVRGQAARSRHGFQAVHAQVAAGVYRVVVTRDGEVLGSGEVETGRASVVRIGRAE